MEARRSIVQISPPPFARRVTLSGKKSPAQSKVGGEGRLRGGGGSLMMYTAQCFIGMRAVGLARLLHYIVLAQSKDSVSGKQRLYCNTEQQKPAHPQITAQKEKKHHSPNSPDSPPLSVRTCKSVCTHLCVCVVMCETECHGGGRVRSEVLWCFCRVCECVCVCVFRGNSAAGFSRFLFPNRL